MDFIKLFIKGYVGIFFGIIVIYLLVMSILSVISYFV